MPEQKLTSPEELIAEFDQMILDAPNGVLDRKTMAKWIREHIQNKTLEVAAQECDAIDTALNDGTITKQENSTWPYDRPDVKHKNASIYVERTAIAIRSLIQKEGEPDAQENQS